MKTTLKYNVQIWAVNWFQNVVHFILYAAEYAYVTNVFHDICQQFQLCIVGVWLPVAPFSNIPNSKVHGANMGPIWGRQDPGGPHVCPMNFAIWDGLPLIPTWISNHMPSKEWDEITYPFLNFNGATVEN